MLFKGLSHFSHLYQPYTAFLSSNSQYHLISRIPLTLPSKWEHVFPEHSPSLFWKKIWLVGLLWYPQAAAPCQLSPAPGLCYGNSLPLILDMNFQSSFTIFHNCLESCGIAIPILKMFLTDACTTCWTSFPKYVLVQTGTSLTIYVLAKNTLLDACHEFHPI